MATAGEAASLFGATDSANDPFALPPPEAPQPSDNDPFANVQPTAEAADLFGSAAFQGSAQVSQQGFVSSYETMETQDANWNGSSGNQYTPSTSQVQQSYGYTPQASYVAQPATNGYNDARNQWSDYTPQQQQYGTVNGTYTNGAYAQSTQTNDPYAPHANQSYAPSKVPHATAQNSMYDPYAPSTNSYSTYTTPAASHASAYDSSYDPYKPSQTASAPPHAGQPSSTYVQFLNGSVEPAQQPEAPVRNAAAAEQYRPKTFDAYDPPLPPAKPAHKRPAAWQSPITSPVQPAYPSLPNSPAFRSAQSPSLPPPPRKASVPPPPRTGSASRQYASSPVPPPFPHTQVAYGAQHHSPSNTISPPPRSDSAARRYATPPLPHSSHPPFTSPPYEQPPPPRPPMHQTSSPPFTYQTPPPPSVYQTLPPHSAHQHSPLTSIHEPPPPQTTTGYGFVAAPAPPDPYIPAGTPEYAQPQPGSQSAANAAETRVVESDWNTAQVLEQEGVSVTHQHSEDSNDPEANAVLSTIEEQQSVAAESTVAEDHEQPSITTEAEVGMHTAYESGALHVEETVVNEAVPVHAQEVDQPVLQPPPVAEAPAVQPTHDPYRPALAPAHVEPVYEIPANTVPSSQVPPAQPWSPPRQSVESSRPAGVSSPPVPTPPTRSSTDSYRPSPYSYEPAATPVAMQRTTSPSSISTHSGKSTYSIHDAYAPPAPAATSSNARYRSASNGSMLSLNSVHSVQDDPYAPARHSRQQSTESSSFTTARTFADDSSLVTPTAPSQAQVVTLTAPMRSQYAPSPSLLGSNDPLGRTSVRVPVFTFGFGGQIVTCFHGSEMLQTGFDVAMSSRASTSLRIRPLNSIIPQSAIETSAATFPGPLFSDPGTPTTTLVRPGAATHAKAKKAKVVKYLEERAEEITQGLGYLHQGSVDLYRAEAKCALINLLKVMVENDGRLSGTPQIDASVRAALIPSAEPVLDSSEPATSGARTAFDLTSSSYGSLSSLAYDTKNTKLADHPLWSSQLDKIEALLVRGDRRGAYHYAADEKLWAHAMVIASSIDKEAWKEVVTEFVHSELSGGHATAGASAVQPSSVDRREPLKVAYSLFAGQGSAAVQELHPPKPLGAANHSLSALPAAAAAASTPLSAGFAQPVQAVELPKEVLMKWSTTAAMMIGSPLTMDSSSALTVLGDHLAFNGWHEAAHVCYLLSPQTSLVGGVRLPGVRVVLYGSPNPYTTPIVCKDPDAVIFSEVVEYARSLTPPAKGQELFAGLPHLQPYRLLRASYLAELGHVALAKRYCDAISTSTNRASPYLNVTFKEQLDDLRNRLEAAPVMDKSGSWIGSKMAKPSLDKIGGWLEGRFTSFIAGEGDSPNPAGGSNKVPTFSGPFTQYGEISSTNNSNIPSPQMSSTNLAQMQAQAQPAAPPFRTGSAMALRASTTSPAQIARASSAIDYLRRKPSPVHRASSANVSPATGLPARTQPTYGYPNGFASPSNPDMSTPTVQEEVPVTSNGPSVASWWGGGESESATPTATTFVQPDEPLQQSSSDGFISLVDTPGFSGPSSTTTAQFTAAAHAQSIGQDELDEEDDLGLGNSSNRKKEASESTEPEEKAAAPAAVPEKHQEPEKHAASGGGWLSRLWKRSDSSGPIKANLGDENTFYYDAEQKRWVNKNAPPAESAKPPPPRTPPVRPQTASPGMTSARGPPPPSSPLPPPVRPATAIDLTDGPPKKPPMRIRSNLAPPDGFSGPNTPGSAPLPSIPRTPNTTMDGPPGMDGLPPSGARKAGVKRNARSRYVDVFQ